MDGGWTKRRQIGIPPPPVNPDESIKNGALWDYCKNAKVFRCPAGKVSHMLTYCIVGSINGVDQAETKTEQVWAKNRGDLSKTQGRIVFIDAGEVRKDSYDVSYTVAEWLHMPPVRHRDGVTVSFADAHSVYWKWTRETADIASDPTLNPPKILDEGIADLQKMQKATYGRLRSPPW